MATNYPAGLDNLTNPVTTDPVNSPSHAVQHANANDAIEALQAKVGIENSLVTTSIDYRVRQLEANPTGTANKITQLVINNTGSTLLKGQVVYASGSVGASGQLRVSLSSNSSESTSSKTFGVLAENIIQGGQGTVVCEGLIEGIDTTGANDGDPIWLGSTAGSKIFGLTNKPSAPAHLVFVGIVVRGGNANNGSIFVKVQNGFELDELHTVSISSLADKDILTYDSATGLWKNKTFTTLDIATKTYVDSSVNNLSNTVTTDYVPVADVGQADGVASLDSTGKIPDSQIPAGIARDSEVSTAIANLVNSAPSTLDTLNELATALGNDANFSTTITNSIGNKVSKSGGDTITASTASTTALKIFPSSNTPWPNNPQTANVLEVYGRDQATIALAVRNNLYDVFIGNLSVGNNVFSNYQVVGGAIAGNLGNVLHQFNSWNPSWATLGIRGSASQTANLQEWQNSAGTKVSTISPLGYLSINKSYTSYPLEVNGSLYAKDASTSNLYIQGGNNLVYPSVMTSTGGNGWTSVTANYAAAPDGTTTATRYVWSSGGNCYVTSNNFITNLINVFYTASIYIKPNNSTSKIIFSLRLADSSDHANVEFDSSTNTVTYSQRTPTSAFSNGTASSIYIGNGWYRIWVTAKSSTAFTNFVTMLTTIQNNGDVSVWGAQLEKSYYPSAYTPTTNAAITATNNIYVPSGNIYAPSIQSVVSNTATLNTNADTGGILIDTTSASNKGFIIKGAASQTANLQEWQDSAGNILVRIASNGYTELKGGLGVPSNVTISYALGVGGASAYLNSSILAVSTVNGGPSSIGVLVKGMSGQTGNLQEWQNSAGTVLARITSTGAFDATAITVNGSPISGGGLTPFTISSNTALSSNSRYLVDTTAARTLTLPASPSVGDEIQILDASGTANTYNITVTRNGKLINGNAGNLIIDTNGGWYSLVYTGNTYGWKVG